MAKCPVCRGKGYRLRIDDMRFAMAEIVKCESCDGKGVVEPLTEQEYIQTCTTEQLAEIVLHLAWDTNEIFKMILNDIERSKEIKIKIVKEWLKQPTEVTENEMPDV